MLAEWMVGEGAACGWPMWLTPSIIIAAGTSNFATVCARDRAQAVAGLAALAGGQTAVGVVGAHEGPCGPGTVFVYSGQGSQWAGMGRRLLADEPAFAAAVAELEPVFVKQVGFSLQRGACRWGAGQRGCAGAAGVDGVAVGADRSCGALWGQTGCGDRAFDGGGDCGGGCRGAEPGRGIAGDRDSLAVDVAAGKTGCGGPVELDAEATAALIVDFAGVSLAGYVSPRQTVIAGPVAPVDAVIAAVTAQDRFARRVNMEVASHTALMDPILAELRSALADLAPKAPTIPFISTVADTPTLDADYWVANVRQPVRFTQAIAAAAEHHATFIEISPHPTLTYAITETLESTHHHSIGTLWRDGDDTVSFHTNLNSTHIAQPPHTPHPPEPHPVLPTTPWHHTQPLDNHRECG